MAKKQLVFIDDDPDEVETFLALYKGSRFNVLAKVAADPADASEFVRMELRNIKPDLFVLDLYFPTSRNAPRGFKGLQEAELKALRARLDDVKSALDATREILERQPEDGKALLRKAQSIRQRSDALLDSWCKQLQQSPPGGLELLAVINSAFPKVPKVFYSRKATLKDAKQVFAAGAVDLLSKPDASLETSQASELGDIFAAYADRQVPSFLSEWLRHLSVNLGVSAVGPFASVSAKLDARR